MSEVDVTGAVSSAVSGIGGDLGPIAGYGLAIGGAILALTIGWRLVKRLAK